MGLVRWVITAGTVTVLVCAVIFEVIERRKRKLFKESLHDLAQKYIDQMNQEERIKQK